MTSAAEDIAQQGLGLYHALGALMQLTSGGGGANQDTIKHNRFEFTSQGVLLGVCFKIPVSTKE
jgi:hypothetical protein